MKKFAIAAILLFLSINLTSCINIVRNIKVEKDGSGSENIILDFDKTFFDVMIAFATMTDSSNYEEVRDSLYNDEDFVKGIKDKLVNVPGLELKDIYSMTNPDSSKTIYASYTFDKIDILGISISDKSPDALANNVIVEYKDMGENIKFTYTEVEEQLDHDPNDTTYANLLEGIAEMFKGKEAVYNIEFDYDIVSSNATTTEGRKLTWRIPLDEKMLNRNGVYLEAVLRK